MRDNPASGVASARTHLRFLRSPFSIRVSTRRRRRLGEETNAKNAKDRKGRKKLGRGEFYPQGPAFGTLPDAMGNVA
jgi:hypothetical protein